MNAAWLILLWIVFGILTGSVAVSRGRNGLAWLLIGFLLGPLGLIVACSLPKTDYVYLPTHVERMLYMIAVAMGSAAELGGLAAAKISGKASGRGANR